jgi:hypothetical protein
MKVCLFVCSLCIQSRDSYCHQTFHGTSLGPKDGHRGVDAISGGVGKRVLGEVSSKSCYTEFFFSVITSITKLFAVLP